LTLKPTLDPSAGFEVDRAEVMVSIFATANPPVIESPKWSGPETFESVSAALAIERPA
jgi:hypothetical protein